jgi:DNA-binding NarL/FixJ family response regulator
MPLIEQVLADQRIYAATNSDAALSLPPLVRDLEIDYTALSLVAPEKVFFRYMLEGWDEEWQEVGSTMFAGDVEIQRALAGGAKAYLLKSMPHEQIVDTIRQVHRGKKRVLPEIASRLAEHLGDETLMNREIDVLQRVTEGNRNRDIAEKLLISEETVKVHIKHAMEKLGASDRTHAVAIASRRGFFSL